METSSFPAVELIWMIIVVNPEDAYESGVAVIGMLLLSPGPMLEGASTSTSQCSGA